MAHLLTRGLSVDLQILDNEASAAYKEAIMLKWHSKFQLVPPEMHRRNQAERAIRTFKDHFLAILAGVDKSFPPYLWDLLLPQAELTLNLLHQSYLNPWISAWSSSMAHSTLTRPPLTRWVVVSSSIQSLPLVDLGTSAQKTDSTLAQL